MSETKEMDCRISTADESWSQWTTQGTAQHFHSTFFWSLLFQPLCSKAFVLHFFCPFPILHYSYACQSSLLSFPPFSLPLSNFFHCLFFSSPFPPLPFSFFPLDPPCHLYSVPLSFPFRSSHHLLSYSTSSFFFYFRPFPLPSLQFSPLSLKCLTS